MTEGGAAEEWRPGIEESRWGPVFVGLWIVLMCFPAGIRLGLSGKWFVAGFLGVAATVPLGLVAGAAAWWVQSRRARMLGVTARRMVAVNRLLRGRVPAGPGEQGRASSARPAPEDPRAPGEERIRTALGAAGAGCSSCCSLWPPAGGAGGADAGIGARLELIDRKVSCTPSPYGPSPHADG